MAKSNSILSFYESYLGAYISSIQSLVIGQTENLCNQIDFFDFGYAGKMV